MHANFSRLAFHHSILRAIHIKNLQVRNPIALNLTIHAWRAISKKNNITQKRSK